MKIAILITVALLAFVAAEVPLKNEDSVDRKLHNYILLFHENITKAEVDAHIAEVNQTVGTVILHVYHLGTFNGFAAHLNKDVLAKERTRDDLYDYIEVDGRAHIPPVLTNPDSEYVAEKEMKIEFWDFIESKGIKEHLANFKRLFGPKSFVRGQWSGGPEVRGYYAHVEPDCLGWMLREDAPKYITYIHRENTAATTAASA